MKSQTRMGLAFHFVRTGLEPLGRSVKKTVLWTVFSDGSCGSSSVRFREAKAHQVPSLAPKRTALAGPVFSDGNCGSSSVRFREAKARTVRNIVVSLAWSASRYSLFLPVRQPCFICHRQRSAANQVPSLAPKRATALFLCYNQSSIPQKGVGLCSVFCCPSSMRRSSVWVFRTRSWALPGRRSTRNSVSRCPTPASSRPSSRWARSSLRSSAHGSSRS